LSEILRLLSSHSELLARSIIASHAFSVLTAKTGEYDAIRSDRNTGGNVEQRGHFISFRQAPQLGCTCASRSRPFESNDPIAISFSLEAARTEIVFELS
jgi:hypothetical protein